MDTLLALKALIMGIVEGLTEFLPISSTGHLILTNSLLQFTGPDFSKEKADVFEIVIQAGAILAVCWEYRVRIATVLGGMFTDRRAQRLIINLIIAFLPAAILGFLFSRRIKEVLFNPVSVAVAFIVGGLIILWVERRNKDRLRMASARVESVDDMTPLDALKVGIAQAFALIPGTSRSGATIIGGMMFGLSRKAATEFSFFLAIPTLFAATIYSLQGACAAVGGRYTVVQRGYGGGLRLGLPVRTLAAALHQLARFHPVRLVSHRLRHRRAGDLLYRRGGLGRINRVAVATGRPSRVTLLHPSASLLAGGP